MIFRIEKARCRSRRSLHSVLGSAQKTVAVGCSTWLGIFSYPCNTRQQRPADKTADVPSHTDIGKKRNGQSNNENEPEPRSQRTPLTAEPCFNGTFGVGLTPSGEIEGVFVDAKGVLHGFVRSIQGSFTTYDVPGATMAEAQSQIDAHNAAVEEDNPEAKMMAEAGFLSLVVPSFFALPCLASPTAPTECVTPYGR